MTLIYIICFLFALNMPHHEQIQGMSGFNFENIVILSPRITINFTINFIT
jgi:hypothetical protein